MLGLIDKGSAGWATTCMVEPGWRAVADRIIEWLGSRGL